MKLSILALAILSGCAAHTEIRSPRTGARIFYSSGDIEDFAFVGAGVSAKAKSITHTAPTLAAGEAAKRIFDGATELTTSIGGAAAVSGIGIKK